MRIFLGRPTNEEQEERYSQTGICYACYVPFEHPLLVYAEPDNLTVVYAICYHIHLVLALTIMFLAVWLRTPTHSTALHELR